MKTEEESSSIPDKPAAIYILIRCTRSVAIALTNSLNCPVYVSEDTRDNPCDSVPCSMYLEYSFSRLYFLAYQSEIEVSGIKLIYENLSFPEGEYQFVPPEGSVTVSAQGCRACMELNNHFEFQLVIKTRRAEDIFEVLDKLNYFVEPLALSAS